MRICCQTTGKSARPESPLVSLRCFEKMADLTCKKTSKWYYYHDDFFIFLYGG